MKLYWSAASPYARKCRILIRELDLRGVDEVVIDPFSDPGELIASNPLGKVPLLVRGGGVPLFDSRVICAYLDGLGGERRLLPDDHTKRLNVLRAEALADGVMDLSVSLSLERRKPEGEKTPSFAARWREQLERGLDAMTSELTGFGPFSLADAAFASALGYLDYRQPKIDWRATRKSLDRWFADVSQRTSLAETAPPPR